MVANGELVPDLKVLNREGGVVSLWDFRQKSHVTLIHEPAAPAEKFQEWMSAVDANKKLWTWLDVQFLRAATDEKLAPGAYLIDRYGRLIQFMASGQWDFAKIEKEYISYEACNC